MRARVHEHEAGWDRRRAHRPPSTRVLAWGLADELAKGGAEGTETSKPDLEADLGDREAGAAQKILRALDPASQEVLVRCFAEGLLEAAAEMGRGGVGLARKCRDVELVGVLPVDQILRP